MKKILSLALLVPFLMFSCQETDVNNGDGKGQITIQGTSTVELTPNVITRAGSDPAEYTLFVENEDNGAVVASGLLSGFPGGVVDNIPAGSYKLTLTSHPDGFTPAFGDPAYRAVKNNVIVADGGNTLVDLEAEQSNAGVYFVYDESLYTIGGFSDVVPTITQGSSALVYEGANAEAWGYFNPGNAVLTLAGGLTLSGETSQVLELDEKQLWEITLKVSGTQPGTGALTITASVKVITSPTDYREFIVGEGEATGQGGYVTISMFDVTSLTGTMHIIKNEGGPDITAGEYAIFTQGLVDQLADRGISLEEAMASDDYGYALEELDIMLINTVGQDMPFNLGPDLDLVALVWAEANGVYALSKYEFSTPAAEPGPQQGYYFWDWYKTFNSEYTSYSDGYTTLLDLWLYNSTWTLYDFYGVTGLVMVANYDADTHELTLTGKDVYGYDYVNTPDGLYFGDYEYSAGFYVWDENLNPVSNIVFLCDEDGYIVSSKYHITMDWYVYGSDGRPEDFVTQYELAPMGDPITLFMTYSESAPAAAATSKYTAVGAQKTAQKVVRPAMNSINK